MFKGRCGVGPVIEVCHFSGLVGHVIDEVVEVGAVTGHCEGHRCGAGFQEFCDVAVSRLPACGAGPFGSEPVDHLRPTIEAEEVYGLATQEGLVSALRSFSDGEQVIEEAGPFLDAQSGLGWRWAAPGD
jgi:hypothetical protein